mgnify:CR=1 FL=1|jgi:hypothetical protein
MVVGNSVPMIAITAGIVYGVTKFNYGNEITSVGFQNGGEHNGWLKITIHETPFCSKTITVNPAHIMSIASHSADTQGAQDTNKHIMHISQFVDSNGKVNNSPIVASLPADAYHEMTALEWITQPKNEGEETLGMFNDLVKQDLATKSATGGITGFAAWNLKSLGFRHISNDEAKAKTEIQIDSQ